MRTRGILLVLVFSSSLAADNLEKTQKKELEAQVKTMTAEAQRLEKTGQLAEARTKYAESQALIEMKDVTEAIKHLDEEIHKRVKDALSESRKLYDVRKFKEAATALDEGMKLQAFQSVLAYDLALCYYQLGERNKALEYLGRAKAGTADPKQKQKLSQLLTFFTTGENGVSANDSDKDRINRVNRLSESIGVEASLEDEGGEESALSQAVSASSELPASGTPSSDTLSSDTTPANSATARAVSPVALKPSVAANSHSNIHASQRSSLCNALR